MANKNHSNIEIRRIVEYKYFFPGEAPIDVDSVLRQYKKSSLIRMAIILSCHYGNLTIPDNKRTLFSDHSIKYIDELNHRFKQFCKLQGVSIGTPLVISTFRTALELWRHIFAIHSDEYSGTMNDDDAEYNLFKVLLTLNEKLVAFTHDAEAYQLDELLFLNQYLTNDSNNYDFKQTLQPQLYYFYNLVEECEQNEVLKHATTELFKRWGITSWQQYVATLMYIANQTEEYRNGQQGGVPIINIDRIKAGDKTGLFSESLVDALSIDEEACIPFEDPEVKGNAQNVDYRVFRSKPFIRFKTGEYAVINIQLLCERVYNSLYFDFQPLIRGGKGSLGFYDYNKSFVEKILFRKTIFKCIPPQWSTFPPRKNAPEQEDPHEPDFYTRHKSNLVICECKAIKMNGGIRDDGDYRRLLDELHEKIVLKTKNIDPSRKQHKGEPEPIGIGQLIHHIEAIDQDDFQWDNNIPEEVIYYPILVFEDVRLLQPGLLSILNRWFNEELTKKSHLSHIACGCQPVMAVSINTLFLYDNLISKKSLTKIIDRFVASHSTVDKDGNTILYEDAVFDEYLRHNPYNKGNYMGEWLIKKS